MLVATDRPLLAEHDLLVLDLDGVVYRGPAAVPGAAEALEEARRAGVGVAFVTNNAARTPEDVAAHLTRLGVRADAADVVTSAQAASRLVAEQVPAGRSVYVIGGTGLVVALRERGLRPVTDLADVGEDGAAAVVQGYGPDMPWRQVVDGAILVRGGTPWVASNTDLTMPTDRGIGPGNGTLVRLVADYAGRTPVVAGKPEPALLQETLDRVGGRRPLMIGDRLDTDIAGAGRVGWPSLLVLTGVTGLAELLAAESGERPQFVASGLAGLAEPQPVPSVVDDEVHLGSWRGVVRADRLEITGSGSVDDWWRVAAVTGWRHLDATGHPAEVGDTKPPEPREPQTPHEHPTPPGGRP
ncbi:MAG: HAD-IIA family hydrolase [Marmoricola sp.]